MRTSLLSIMIVAALAVGTFSGFALPTAAQDETGTLQLVANGEDFVRQGFVTKDGWQVQFEHVYVTLGNITAFQVAAGYDADAGNEVTADVSVALSGVHTVDLAAGDENAEPILVGEVDAPAGFYNAIAFDLVEAADGPAAGYSLVMIGTAERDSETVDFTIKVTDELEFTCGEYVGDMRKGILDAGGVADVEMTFHFDHVFGDAETPMDDGLNTGALGFDPLALLATDGAVDVDSAALESGLSVDEYQKFLDILPTLGHVGEGHCHCETTGPSGLLFTANGEDFVRQGFTTKDGWNVTFDHVYVTLADITGYQADPPYDAHTGDEVQADTTVGLDGVYTVDLAEGDENAEPIFVGNVPDAADGFYNAISFGLVQAPEGICEGYSLVIVGTAEKDGETIAFTIKLDDEYAYTCGEYIGDVRKGILQEGGAADLEMTFHFDHIFGDADLSPDDELNEGALGMAPFAALAQDDVVDVDSAALEAMLSSDDLQMLLDVLPTLGHVGEGHCHCEPR